MQIKRGSSLYLEGVYEVKIKMYEFGHTFGFDRAKSVMKCPLRYEDCGKRFVSSRNRDRHYKNVHFKQKGYECETCQKAFGRIDNLQRHMEMHKGKKELANKSDSEDEDFEKSSNSEDTSDDGEDIEGRHIPERLTGEH